MMDWLWRRAPIQDPGADFRYAVAIDSGSSGSRLEIYSWLDHQVAEHGLNSTELSRLPDIKVNGKQKKYSTYRPVADVLESILGFRRLQTSPAKSAKNISNLSSTTL